MSLLGERLDNIIPDPVQSSTALLKGKKCQYLKQFPPQHALSKKKSCFRKVHSIISNCQIMKTRELQLTGQLKNDFTAASYIK